MTTPTESVSFVVLGPPVPKGRPRFVRGRAVTPKRTREYEALVKQVAALHCGHWRRDGLYRVTLVLRSRAMLRGDTDNYIKALLDGMEGHAFDNDRQVAAVRAAKEPGWMGEPLAEVTVERIGDWPVKRRKAAATMTINSLVHGPCDVVTKRRPTRRAGMSLEGVSSAVAMLWPDGPPAVRRGRRAGKASETLAEALKRRKGQR